MSPEQARGRRVDKLTGIWAFGALPFELLTGGRAFAGETVTDVLAAAVQDEPPWERLPAGVPVGVCRLLLVTLLAAAGLAGWVIGVAWSLRAAPAPAEPVRRLSITGPGWSDVEAVDVTLMQNLMALSPDGSRSRGATR